MSRRDFFQLFCMFYLQCINRKCAKEKKHQHLTLYQNWNRTPVYFKLAVSASLLFAEYSVKSPWFDILRKYTIYFLEPTRNFTFVHMLNCQLCFKQPCWLHVMEFAKSVTPIRFWNFVSLMVDNIIKNVFFISFPHLTSQFWYFDDLVGFREYFSFKRT